MTYLNYVIEACHASVHVHHHQQQHLRSIVTLQRLLPLVSRHAPLERENFRFFLFFEVSSDGGELSNKFAVDDGLR